MKTIVTVCGAAIRALWFSTILMSGVAFAANPMRVEIPGFSVSLLSGPGEAEGGDEWWMASTEPLEMTRYALTNETITRPITVTILHYASPEQAKKAFQMSWRGRPQAPTELNVAHWNAAHRWPSDLFLLKGSYAVGVYNLPLDFSAEQTGELLDPVANCIAKAEKNGAAHGRHPFSPKAIRTSSGTATAAACVAGKIYANCDNAFVLYVNDLEVLRNNDWTTAPSPACASLTPGDVISVRVSDFGGAYGFAFLYCSNDKTRFFSANTNNWHTYAPADEIAWWHLPDGADVKLAPAMEGNNNNVAAELQFQSDAPCKNVIWGETGQPTAFLLHVVTESDLKKVR